MKTFVHALQTFVYALILLVAAPLFANGDTQTTTVLLVRHAESVQKGDDPVLTEVGTARAEELARVAEHAGVEAVFVTQFRRTKDTAAPLAAATKIPVIEMDAKHPEHVKEVARRIYGDFAGKTVLVVGHSNTIPEIVKELTGFDVPKIVHEDNSRLFIVAIGREKQLVAAQYGCTP